VKAPRLRIDSIMLVVAIAALDFAAIRAGLEFPSLVSSLLLSGALPMANAIALALLMGYLLPGDRPFILGFVAFGAIALVIYVAISTSFPNELVNYCADPVDEYLNRFVGRNELWVLWPMRAVVYLWIPMAPQMAFAMVGGLLTRKFKMNLWISHQRNRTPA